MFTTERFDVWFSNIKQTVVFQITFNLNVIALYQSNKPDADRDEHSCVSFWNICHTKLSHMLRVQRPMI